MKKPLYRCLKCGKEFANKSRKSDHKKSCPQKEQEDVEQETEKVVEEEKKKMETDEKDENNDNMQELLRLVAEAAKKPKLDT